VRADRQRTWVRPDGRDIEPVGLRVTFRNAGAAALGLDLHELARRGLRLEVSGPSTSQVDAGPRKRRAAARADRPRLRPGQRLSPKVRLTFPGDFGGKIYRINTPGWYQLRLTYEQSGARRRCGGARCWTGRVHANPLWLEVLPSPQATVLASCAEIVSTGKRHNSYLFTFRVEKVLEGKMKKRTFTTRELYSDFGGKQLIQKLEASGIPRWSTRRDARSGARTRCKHRVVARLRGARRGRRPWSILWIARVGRDRPMRELEKLATALIDAVARNDHARLAPYLAPSSGLTRRRLAEIVRHAKRARVDFEGLVTRSLIRASGGRLVLGGGIYPYLFWLQRRAGADSWVISRVERR
jgi:hypothetical protein